MTENTTPPPNTAEGQAASPASEVASSPPPTPAVAAVAAEARIHGAARIPDSVYWTGHVVGLCLLVLAIAFLVASRGPRRREALEASQATTSPTLPHGGA